MAIQIFGFKKCSDTRKAERFFKERGVQAHFIDLAEKAMSPGELDSVGRAVGMDNLIDRESKAFEKLGLKFMKFDPREELLEHPELLKTPVVRNGTKAAVGDASAVWTEWVKSLKN